MRIFLYAVVTLIAIILLFTPAHDIGAGVIAALLLGVVDISYGNIELLRFVLPFPIGGSAFVCQFPTFTASRSTTTIC